MVLFIMLYKVALILAIVDEASSVTIQMSSTFCDTVYYTVHLHNVIPTFRSVDAIFKCVTIQMKAPGL